MRERPLSASSIKTYLQCALQYYFRYEDKKPRQGKTDPLAFGIAMHEALEFMHQKVSDSQQAPTPDLYKEVIQVFMTSATSHGLSSLDTYQEGRDLLMTRLDRVSPEEKVVGLELRFELKTPKGTPFLGSIDKLVELDPETALIVDYKTSRMALSQPEADTDIQLSMYDLAVSLMYPQYKTIISAFDYLRLSEVVTHRTAEQRVSFIDFLDTIYAQICAASKETIDANLNTLCPWCDFKVFCEDYRKVVEDPDLLLPPPGELDTDTFVQSWATLSAAKKIIDKRQRELKDDAYQRMRNAPVISGESKEIYKVQTSRINYDTRTVFKIVGQEDYMRMSSVSKGAVDKFLKNNPEHLKAVTESSSFSFNSPSFRIRKRKDVEGK